MKGDNFFSEKGLIGGHGFSWFAVPLAGRVTRKLGGTFFETTH